MNREAPLCLLHPCPGSPFQRVFGNDEFIDNEKKVFGLGDLLHAIQQWDMPTLLGFPKKSIFSLTRIKSWSVFKKKGSNSLALRVQQLSVQRTNSRSYWPSFTVLFSFSCFCLGTLTTQVCLWPASSLSFCRASFMLSIRFSIIIRETRETPVYRGFKRASRVWRKTIK